MVAANIYMKSFSLSVGWVKLADVPTVVTATIVTSGRGPFSFRVNGGPIASWPAGIAVRLEGVDLSQIEVSGPIGNLVLVVANTR